MAVRSTCTCTPRMGVPRTSATSSVSDRIPRFVARSRGAFGSLSFFGAPGRAHLLGGESPLLTRQGEELAGGKGDAGDRSSGGSPKQSAGLTNRKRI